MELNVAVAPDTQSLHAKVDLLTQQVTILTEQLASQQRRQQELDELKQDIVPIINHMIKLSIDELADIGAEFQSEDLVFLLKRTLRSTNNFIRLLDSLDGAMGFADETKILGKEMFNSAISKLDVMEHEGYFEFARGANYILQQILQEFEAEDIKALGDNVVTILKTVRNMTQPEVLAIANNAVSAVQEAPVDQNISTWALLRELSDPKVKRGMARMLNLVKVMADQPSVGINN